MREKIILLPAVLDLTPNKSQERTTNSSERGESLLKKQRQGEQRGCVRRAAECWLSVNKQS